MSCACTPPKYKVGDRVWVESAKKYGTIDRVNLPPACSADCENTPCKACGGDGVDVLAKRSACKRCKGHGTEPRTRSQG